MNSGTRIVSFPFSWSGRGDIPAGGSRSRGKLAYLLSEHTLILHAQKELMAESAKKLGEAERKAREHAKAVKAGGASEIAGDFPLGMEWDIVIADAVVLGGLTQALNETYAGYLQAMLVLSFVNPKALTHLLQIRT
jgi:hypothetical protein